jgi:hypothetical protein
MCSSRPRRILPDIPEVGPIAVPGRSVMENRNFPGTLSPCVRIFLEILCDEAFAVTPVQSPMPAPFPQAVTQPQQQNSTIELQ